MVDFSNEIMSSMYLSNDGLDKWDAQFGSFNDIYPLSQGLKQAPKSPSCKMRSYYDYYISQYPLSMGLDPTPWQYVEGDCECNYAHQANSRWFANEDYMKRMYGQPITQHDLVYDYPLFDHKKGCGYCADLKQKDVLNLRDDMYLINGQEIDMRM